MRKLHVACIATLIAVVAVPMAITGALAGAEDGPIAEPAADTVAPALAAPADEPAAPAVLTPPAPAEDATAEPTAPTDTPQTAVVPESSDPTADATVQGPAAVTAQQSCHPSYADVCVPTDIGDVNCDDVNGSSFPVVGPDVFDLDGNDDDGIACESNPPATPVPAPTVDTPVAPPATAPANNAMVAAPVAPAAPVAEVQAAVQQACDPNYSGCVPTGVGDVNCSGAGGTNLTVTGSDVHGLDSDNDGIACEDAAATAAAPVSRSVVSGRISGSLASTGGDLALGGLGGTVLLLGLVLVGMAGVLGSVEHRRRRGGFVVVATNWLGEETRTRVVTPRRWQQRWR